MLTVRNYHVDDYDALKTLYMHSDLYGGQFDMARDAPEKLLAVTKNDPQAILICEDEKDVLGTVSLIENGRVAWLFRFAVKDIENKQDVTEKLYTTACDILMQRGHEEVLVYSPYNNKNLDQRYLDLGMTKGSPYTCFWHKLEH